MITNGHFYLISILDVFTIEYRRQETCTESTEHQLIIVICETLGVGKSRGAGTRNKENTDYLGVSRTREEWVL